MHASGAFIYMYTLLQFLQSCLRGLLCIRELFYPRKLLSKGCFPSLLS